MLPPDQAMEFIWDKVTKNNDTITYSKSDLVYMYYDGFVNTKKFSLTKWQNAFKPFKDKNGNFTLNKKQFLTLRQFRYNYPVVEAFDAFKMREGPWSDEELKLLYDRSIKQASTMPENIFWHAIEGQKKAGKVTKDGEIIINIHIKAGIDFIVRQYPTPRTRLERKVMKLKLQGSQGVIEDAKKKNKSGFSAGTSAIETTMASLQSLQGTSSSKAQKKEPEVDEAETLDLKKLRKPKPKVFG